MALWKITKSNTKMAKIYQGPLGNFSGKVGTVVGYMWRGRPCIRVYRHAINYPNTEQQQQQRDWFVRVWYVSHRKLLGH